jgi:uncharacterized protein
MFYGKSSVIHLILMGSVFTLSVGLMGCTVIPPVAPAEPIAAAPSSSIGQTLPITATAQLAGKTFQLEVAQTPDQQAMGLMYRPALPDDRGMLFPMESPRPVTFWMRNVPVSLDMVFVYNGSIVAIASNVPPCATTSCPTYGPRGLVDQVLELRAGRASELGLKAGDLVVIAALK